MSGITKRDGLLYVTVTIAVTFALTLGLLIALPTSAQDDGASRAFNCDAATVALVLAAQDAYGFTSTMDMGMMDATMSGGGGGTTTAGGDNVDEGNDEDDPQGLSEGEEEGNDDGNDDAEATEEAKLINVAKVTTVLAQDGTEEPGDNEDDGNEDDDNDEGNEDGEDDGNEDGDNGDGSANAGGTGGGMMTNGANCNALRDEAINFIFTTLGLPMGGGMGMGGGNAMGGFTVQMSGPQAAAGDPDATGQGTVWIQNNQVCWNFTVSGATLPATSVVIGQGGEGVTGATAVTLTPVDASGASSGCVDAPAETIAAIQANPGNFYLSIATSDFAEGALRGQLLGSASGGM